MTASAAALDSWVVYCDIFGFSAYVAEQDLDDVCDRLAQGHELLRQRFCEPAGSVHLRLISDSIFLISQVREPELRAQVLEACLEAVQQIMSEFMDLGLPLRGGIAYGPVRLSTDVLVGNAIVRAVRHESMIAAPFVFLPSRELDGIPKSDWPSGIRDVKVKRGLQNGLLLGPLPAEGAIDFAQGQASRYCLNGPPDMALLWNKAARLMLRHHRA